MVPLQAFFLLVLGLSLWGWEAGLFNSCVTLRKVRPTEVQWLLRSPAPVQQGFNPSLPVGNASSTLFQASFSGISLKALNSKEVPSSVCWQGCSGDGQGIFFPSQGKVKVNFEIWRQIVCIFLHLFFFFQFSI